MVDHYLLPKIERYENRSLIPVAKHNPSSVVSDFPCVAWLSVVAFRRDDTNSLNSSRRKVGWYPTQFSWLLGEAQTSDEKITIILFHLSTGTHKTF